MAKSRWLNFFERVIWTAIQVASADLILEIWSVIYGPVENKAQWIVILTPILAAIKNGAAQAFGSDTGAILPESAAPIIPDKVAAVVKGDKIVAGKAVPIQDGKTVEVWPVDIAS